MKLTQRHLEAIQSLIWYVGDDTGRRVTIDWDPDGTPESVDGETGFLNRFDNFSPKLLDELAELKLIECVHEEGTGLGRQPTDYNASIIQLLPEAFMVASEMTVEQADARHAPILLDTYRFKEMLTSSFNREEFIDLCHELGLGFDNLVPSSATYPTQVAAILDYARRHRRLFEVCRAAQAKRPAYEWLDLLKG